MARLARLQGRVGRAKRAASKLRRPPQVRTTARPFVPDARRGRWILAGEHSRSCGQFSASRVERAPEVPPARCAHWTPSRYERAARGARGALASIRHFQREEEGVNSFKGDEEDHSAPADTRDRSTNQNPLKLDLWHFVCVEKFTLPYLTLPLAKGLGMLRPSEGCTCQSSVAS